MKGVPAAGEVGGKVNLSGLQPGNEVEVSFIQMILIAAGYPQQLEPGRVVFNLRHTLAIGLLKLIFSNSGAESADPGKSVQVVEANG